MSLASRMNAAEDGLLTLLQAALPTVDVRLGNPGASPPSEVVWFMEDAAADWDPDVTMGQMTLDEVYELKVKVLVFQSGDDYKAVRDRATVLAATVEGTVGTNRTLGGAVEDSYPIRVERATGATDSGRGVEMTVTVRCRSQVGP